jgi:hydrogenase maturation factor
MMAVVAPRVPDTEERGPAEDLAAAALTLARRFAAGATMWCVTPQWPSHGHHVAVEFVHPVIVGKRALPAISIEGVGAQKALRLMSRPGDILLVVSTADDACTSDLLERAEAWGLRRVWMGAGPRPTGGRAEHVVWLDGADPALATRSGDVVLLYHLLWELTHVVFEHPGLLGADRDCTDDVCITCSDEGRVAEVRSLPAGGMVEVIVNGHPETIDASLVEPVHPGDLLLVHAGVALTTLGDSRS